MKKNVNLIVIIIFFHKFEALKPTLKINKNKQLKNKQKK